VNGAQRRKADRPPRLMARSQAKRARPYKVSQDQIDLCGLSNIVKRKHIWMLT